MKQVRVMTIFGTRPEAIKMAPLVAELQRRPGLQSICCVKAQHREMLDAVLEIFRLKPDYDLNIMEPRQTLSTITSKCLLGMEGVLEQARPDLVLVHGDTSTTFAGALAAFYHQIRVGHVEAGLRTGDKYSPFPEEMNRKLVGDIADPGKPGAGGDHRRGVCHGQYRDRRPQDHGCEGLSLHNGSPQPFGLHRPKDHPRDLPPAGELRPAHG